MVPIALVEIVALLITVPLLEPIFLLVVSHSGITVDVVFLLRHQLTAVFLCVLKTSTVPTASFWEMNMLVETCAYHQSVSFPLSYRRVSQQSWSVMGRSTAPAQYFVIVATVQHLRFVS